MSYTAYLVSVEGNIEYISPAHSLKGARELVEYWKRSSVWEKSFYCKKNNEPPKYILQIEKYWEDYEKSHPQEERDLDELPFC